MQTKRLKPSPKYLAKLRLGMTILAVLILASGFLLIGLAGLDPSVKSNTRFIIIAIFAISDVIWYLPALLLSGPYYRSLSYEIQDDEVIMRVGIWTQSVKHVPYRTVTNLTVNRDILDRWLFGLGTLNIQTAGTSGTTGAEESLVGLDDVQAVYDMVVTELRRFRGGMTPTAAEVEGEAAAISTDTLSEILGEVRAIRQALEKRE